MAVKKRKRMTEAERIKAYKALGMEPPLTARQSIAYYRKIAKNLPTEIKRSFWQEMLDGKTMRDAAEIAGISNYQPEDSTRYSVTLICCELFELCHRKVTYHIPLKLEEIV